MNLPKILKEKSGIFNQQFFLLWQGQFISKLGTFIFDIALILWVKENFNFASMISLILIAGNIPEILLAPVGGTIADIFSRRKILIYSDLVSGLLVIVFSLVIILNLFSPSFNYILLFIVSVGLGISASCFNPAASALIPEFVDDKNLHRANAIFQSSSEITSIAGQAAGGILFTAIGAPFMFLANGISFLFSAWSESFIRTKESSEKVIVNWRTTASRIRNDFIEGYHYTWNDKRLRYFLLIIGLYHFFISPIPILIPFLISDTYKLGGQWTGYLLAGFAAGILSGFIIAGSLKIKENNTAYFIVLLFLISSVLFILSGVSGSVYITMVCLVFNGLIVGMVIVTLITFMQKITPGDMRGRLFGFLNTITNAAIPVGLGIYGIAIDFLRNRLSTPGDAAKIIFIINGCCIFVFMLAIITKADIKNMFSSINNESQELGSDKCIPLES